MKLVIHNGVQFDADNLPAGIEPKDCVPIEEWFAANRSPKPVPTRRKSKKSTETEDG